MDDQSRGSRNRSSLLLVAVARLPDGALHKVIIRNLSESGLKGELSGPRTTGDRLILNLGRAGWVSADVVWANGNQFGARFHRAIDLDKAKRPVRQSAAPEQRWPAERRKVIG